MTNTLCDSKCSKRIWIDITFSSSLKIEFNVCMYPKLLIFYTADNLNFFLQHLSSLYILKGSQMYYFYILLNGLNNKQFAMFEMGDLPPVAKDKNILWMCL